MSFVDFLEGIDSQCSVRIVIHELQSDLTSGSILASKYLPRYLRYLDNWISSIA